MSEHVHEDRWPEEPDENATESVIPVPPPIPPPMPEVEPEEEADEPMPSAEHAPGDLDVPTGYGLLEGQAEGAARRSVGVVVARFNGEITQKLLDNALLELDGLGV